MANYRSPDVYSKEVDQSLYAKANSTSVGAMVGVATKGPFLPQLVTSWPQFEETYGGFRNDSWLAYAVKDFFDNGGSILYVQRTAHYTDASDETTLTATVAKGSLTDNAVTSIIFEGKSAGAFYNGFKINVVKNADSTFDVSVLGQDNTVLEVHQQLVNGSSQTSNERFVDSYLARNSVYVNAVDQGSAVVTGNTILATGSDGLTGITDADYIGSATGRTGIYALMELDTVNLIAIPGIATPAVHTALLAFAEQRADLFAILGTPQSLLPTQVNDYRTGTGTYTHATFNSSYAGMYWPWIKFSNPRTNLVDFKPVEGTVMGLFAANDANANVWDAPAGLNRGKIKNALGLQYNTTRGERDELYSNNINVLVSFKGDGPVIWGQKTLQTKPSATDRINVRRLLISLREDISDTSRYLLFEPNNRRTWEAFKRFVNPLLRAVKDGGGLYDFKVFCDETTNTAFYIDRNIMVAKVFLKPTKTSEFFELQIIVTGTGVDFKLANE